MENRPNLPIKPIAAASINNVKPKMPPKIDVAAFKAPVRKNADADKIEKTGIAVKDFESDVQKIGRQDIHPLKQRTNSEKNISEKSIIRQQKKQNASIKKEQRKQRQNSRREKSKFSKKTIIKIAVAGVSLLFVITGIILLIIFDPFKSNYCYATFACDSDYTNASVMQGTVDMTNHITTLAPQGTVAVKVEITNSENEDHLLRMKLDTFLSDNYLSSISICNYYNFSKWTAGLDGWYYYKEVFNPDETTSFNVTIKLDVENNVYMEEELKYIFKFEKIDLSVSEDLWINAPLSWKTLMENLI